MPIFSRLGSRNIYSVKFHIIVVNVPVYYSDGTRNLPVEIQIRSIAMDLWASLEHELWYKSDREFSGKDEQRLLDCAEKPAFVDRKMQGLFQGDRKDQAGART